jgi:hypothetical protein
MLLPGSFKIGISGRESALGFSRGLRRSDVHGIP